MKTAIALTLALTASAASAEGVWQRLDDGSGIFALSVDRTAIVAVNCTGLMSFLRTTPAGTLKYQIDGNPRYLLKASPTRVSDIETPADLFSHTTFVTGDLLWELMDGTKLMLNWGDTDFDRFSLIGFTETMKTLNCIPVNETHL